MSGRPRLYSTNAERQAAYRSRRSTFCNVPTLLRKTKRHVLSVGGGLSSTKELVMRSIVKYGRNNIEPIMCRLPNEDPDVWRLVEAVENLTGVPIKMIGLNKTPWDIFNEAWLYKSGNG